MKPNVQLLYAALKLGFTFPNIKDHMSSRWSFDSVNNKR